MNAARRQDQNVISATAALLTGNDSDLAGRLSVSAAMTEGELAAAEAIIDRGKHTFIEVGEALMSIRDRAGYRVAGYPTFEVYCRQRWDWSRTHGYNVIAAAAVARNVLSIRHSGAVPTLSQALALAPLPADEQRAVVQDLGDLGQYSTRQLRQALKERGVQRVRDARARILEQPSPPATLSRDVFTVQVADCAALPRYAVGVDLIVTSPPYGLAMHGSDQTDSLDWSEYLDLASQWARGLYRALNDRGRLCLNVPLDRTLGTREPVYADWVQLLKRAGLHYETTHVWKEGNVSNHQARGSVASPNAPHGVAPVENIAVLYKGHEWSLGQPQRPSDITDAAWIDWLSTTWTFAGEHRYRVGHWAPFPEELPRRCILLYSFPGALIGDPFVGSGTTAVAALKLGRRFRGSDIDPECVELTRRRVATEVGSHDKPHARAPFVENAYAVSE